MSVTDWWLGWAGESSAVVVCRSNTTSAVTVTCNGQNYTGAADTSINDGVVSIPVSGVGQSRVPYYIDGALAGTLRAKKTTGPWWIASGSCYEKNRVDVLAFKLLAELSERDLDLVIIQGDFPYCNVAVNLWGENTTSVTSSVANSKNTSLYYAHHRQIRLLPGIKELKRSVPILYMPDDHEYTNDNAARTYLSKYQTDVTGAGSATQTDLDQAWQAARAGLTPYVIGNPPNTDAGIDGDAIYCRGTIGPVEVFITDNINYRSPLVDVDLGSKTMLGVNQKPWHITSINNSSSVFKLWACGKQFWNGGGNLDTYALVPSSIGLGYQTELFEILWGIRSTTGVFAVAGDQHRFTDQYVDANVLGANYPAMSCLVGAPTTVLNNSASYIGFQNYVKWRDNTAKPEPTAQEFVYALFRITETKVDRYFLSTLRGLIPRGFINAGSNNVQHAQQRFG